jgi:integrase
MTLRHYPNQKLPITSELLYQICNACDQQGTTGRTLKAIFTMLFFSFLRQSNIAPKTVKTFDPTRHLVKADIFFAPPGYVIFIKWSKTLQHGRHTLIPVPKITGHPHCPVKAIRQVLTDYPTSDKKHTPLFIMPGTNDKTVTTAYLSDALSVILTSLRVDPKMYSLHSFRRGGASAAYDAGVSYTHVKAHGTWQSDAFWQYITTDTLNTGIPQALSRQFTAKK